MHCFTSPLKEINPLIGFTNKMFKILKSILLDFPEGFEHVGPRIQIPRVKLYIYIYSRLEMSGNSQCGQTNTKLSLGFALLIASGGS